MAVSDGVIVGIRNPGHFPKSGALPISGQDVGQKGIQPRA